LRQLALRANYGITKDKNICRAAMKSIRPGEVRSTTLNLRGVQGATGTLRLTAV
jgi:hypothetical protein